MNIQRAVQVVHMVGSERDVNIHVTCVQMVRRVTDNKLHASARLVGRDLPVTTRVLRLVSTTYTVAHSYVNKT